MARPRLSMAQARLTGALGKNPQRYRPRTEPSGLGPLGSPAKWLTPLQAAMFREFASSMPWLNLSHTGIVEIASILQASLASGTLGTPGMQLLRQCLNQMGGTPVSASKVTMPVKDETDDILD